MDVYSLIDECYSINPVIVLISGLTCSGKTTLSKDLCKRYKYSSPTIISQDNWYKDLKDIKRNKKGYLNMESPEAFHIEEFKKDIITLLSKHSCFIPNYDISKNIRTNKTHFINNSTMVIIEGLHVIEELGFLEEMFPERIIIKVCFDTLDEICLSRRIKRDSKLFKIPADVIEETFNNSIKPNYEQYLNEQLNIVSNYEFGVIIN